MKINKTSCKFAVLIIFSIIILIIPILSINTFFFRNQVLWYFKEKENAYQYLQFIGTFLGVIVSVLGAFIAIEHQIEKEKELQEKNIKQQKEIDIQIKLREDFIQRILETRKSIYNLSCYNLSIGMVSEKVVESEKTGDTNLLFGIEELNTDARDYFHNAYNKYNENMSNLITQLDNYKNKLRHMDYDYYNILKEEYGTILNMYSDINMRISSFPNYTVQMMEYVNLKIKVFDSEIMDLAEKLKTIIEELDKYYITIDV